MVRKSRERLLGSEIDESGDVGLVRAGMYRRCGGCVGFPLL